MAKTKKAKIPKRIGGVKLPKELRKTGEAILDKANSPQGREMLAAGLTMAAAAATAAVARSRANATQTAAEPSSEKSSAAQDPHPQQMADAIGTMTDMLLGRLFGPKKTN